MIAAVDRFVKTIAETVVANEVYFGELDSAAGDGDFGYSLARGFEVVLADFESFDRSTPGSLLKRVGVVIASKVGGTSGPIWGTAFLRAGAAAADRQELGADDVVRLLRAAVEGIQQRGGAVLGDKTLLDALVPGIDSFEAGIHTGKSTMEALAAAAQAIRVAAEGTSALVAKKGRAAYTGERSRGTPDAGAVAIAVLAEALTRVWSREETRE